MNNEMNIMKQQIIFIWAATFNLLSNKQIRFYVFAQKKNCAIFFLNWENYLLWFIGKILFFFNCWGTVILLLKLLITSRTQKSRNLQEKRAAHPDILGHFQRHTGTDFAMDNTIFLAQIVKVADRLCYKLCSSMTVLCWGRAI